MFCDRFILHRCSKQGYNKSDFVNKKLLLHRKNTFPT
ncbi:hypothetical protein EVA_10300 [gut metagenome]|uniref:Uncharacterized protein n=1 Tax=gut metagenome TaxID=749906 RepID=J9G431_9ZZZZ